MKANNTEHTTQPQLASEKKFIPTAAVMDDSGTNKVAGFMATKAEEKQYNDGMAKLAEVW